MEERVSGKMVKMEKIEEETEREGKEEERHKGGREKRYREYR